MHAHPKGTQPSRCQDLKNIGEHTSPSRGNDRKLGTRRSMPPAVPHRGRPATRYETCTSPNCEREAWRYRQSRSSQPPLTCSAAIHALGSGKSGKRHCALSPVCEPRAVTIAHRQQRDAVPDTCPIDGGLRGGSRSLAGGGQMTPTTDTNGLGHCDTGTDACDASSEASVSAGHFGRALQAGVGGFESP